MDYIENESNSEPFIIYGATGSGKSNLAANVFNQVNFQLFLNLFTNYKTYYFSFQR